MSNSTSRFVKVAAALPSELKGVEKVRANFIAHPKGLMREALRGALSDHLTVAHWKCAMRAAKAASLEYPDVEVWRCGGYRIHRNSIRRQHGHIKS